MGLGFWLSRGGIEYLLIVGSMFDIFYTLSKIYEYFNSDSSVLSNLSLLTQNDNFLVFGFGFGDGADASWG